MSNRLSASARALHSALPAELLLSAIIDSSDDAIYSKSADGTITSWNRAAEMMMGYPAEEAVGMPASRLLPEELKSEEAMLMGRLNEGDRVEHYESTRRCRDGTLLPVSLTLSALRAESGELIGASIIARDISAQRASAANNALLAAIVASSDDAIISKNLQGIIMSWNHSAERLFGYRPEEIIGRSVLTLIPPELQYQEPQIIAKLQQGERIDHFETTRVHKSGRRLEVSLTVSPIRGPDGMVVGASKIVRDITEQRRTDLAARLLASIVESSDDAIISKTLQGVVTSWNQGAERMFGYTPDEMIGQPIAKLFPPDRLDEEPRIIERLERGERVEHYQTVRVRKNGELFPVSLTISPIRDGRGVIIGASKIARDVTKEMRAIEQLELANQELKRADRMKSEFLAVISHELRTPLNSIIGFAAVLQNGRSGPITEDQRKQLTVIHGSGRHLLTLINDLLDLSRIEAGRIELEPESFPAVEVIDEAVRTLDVQARQKGLVLTAVVADSPVVYTDRKRLFQIVLNLVNNAIKFTPQGRIDVRIGTERDTLVVAITDTGIGIAKDQQSSLFQAFVQGEGSARRRYEGTGLGLYLSKKIATLLGGSISLQSELNRGSTFTIRLPVNLPSPDRRPAAELSFA